MCYEKVMYTSLHELGKITLVFLGRSNYNPLGNVEDFGSDALANANKDILIADNDPAISNRHNSQTGTYIHSHTHTY